MKLCILAIVAVLGVFGLATAQYGYGGYDLASGTDSDSFGIMSIGLLVFSFFILSLLTRPRSVPLFVGNVSTGVNVIAG